MSKKINLATINATSLNMLSEYHKAYKAICALDAEKRDALKKNRTEMEDYMKTHDPEKDKNYSLEKFVKEEARIQAKYAEDVKPHKEAQKPALALVDSDIYYAYSVAMLKGTLSATGKVSAGKDKEFVVSTSYQKQIRKFLVDMGCSNLSDNTLTKAATAISIRCGGMMKDNKGDYLKLRSNSNFRHIVILAFLQFAISDRKALKVNEDNTLVKNNGENA